MCAISVVIGLAVVVSATPAVAAPVRNLDQLPVALQKYVPGSAAWRSAPWVTSPTCRDRGGDFSLWVVSVLQDSPALLVFFQASKFGPDASAGDKPRNAAILAGYAELAVQLRSSVPAGYCVDDLRRWVGEDPAMRPFGFPWGVTEGEGHQSMYYCTDRDPGATGESGRNRWFGAERAMCDGFFVACAGVSGAEQQRCAAWNAFSDDYVRRVDQMRGRAIDQYPASGTADTEWELRSPEEILREIGGNWFQEQTYSIAQGATAVLAEAMTFWTRSDHTAMLTSPAITEIQGMLRYVGIMLLVGSMMWQGILMMYRRKFDPLVRTGMGLLSFVGWSTLGGTVAVLLNEAGVALATQVLDESINEFSKAMSETMLAGLLVNPGAVFLLAQVVFFLGCVQWVLGFFQAGALMILLAVVPMAASGQLNEATKPWLRKVLSWCLALIMYKPVAACIFVMGFTFMSTGRDLKTLLIGVAILVLAAVSMPALMKFFDWGGQQFVSSGHGGGAMAAGAAASVLGGAGAGGVGRMMEQAGPAASGPTTGAPSVAAAHNGDGADASGYDGGGHATAAASSPSASTGAAGGATAAGAGAEVGAATPAAGPGAGAAAGSGAAAGAGAGAAGSGATAAAGSGAAAAAGPAGVAVMAVQETKAQVGRAVGAVAGAMTDGADQTDRS